MPAQLCGHDIDVAQAVACLLGEAKTRGLQRTRRGRQDRHHREIRAEQLLRRHVVEERHGRVDRLAAVPGRVQRERFAVGPFERRRVVAVVDEGRVEPRRRLRTAPDTHVPEQVLAVQLRLRGSGDEYRRQNGHTCTELQSHDYSTSFRLFACGVDVDYTAGSGSGSSSAAATVVDGRKFPASGHSISSGVVPLASMILVSRS